MSNNYKLIGWIVLTGLLAWGFLSYVDYVFNVITPDSFDFDFEGITIIHFFVFISIFVAGIALFNEKRWIMTVGGVIGIIFLILFGFNYVNLIGVGLFLLMLLNAKKVINEETTKRIKINTVLVFKRGSLPVIIGMFVLISFAAFHSPVVKNVKDIEHLPSATEVFVRGTIDTFLGSQLVIESQEEKEDVLNRVTEETVRELNIFLEPYFEYAPPALAFALFLVLWSLSWAFAWISVPFGIALFWILKKIGFIKIGEKEVKAETLII